MTTSARPSSVVFMDAATRHLYEVFGRYVRPRGEAYSPYANVTAADAVAIRERPLRDLTGRDLAKYAMRAITTWGDADELRYYLPRLLELLVTERGWVDKATVMLNLSTAAWRAWPGSEQEAIEAFVRAAWLPLLAGEMKVSLAELALGCITLERDELLAGGTFGTRWSPEARRVLERVVKCPETRARMERACLLAADADAARLVSDAIEILEMMPEAT